MLDRFFWSLLDKQFHIGRLKFKLLDVLLLIGMSIAAIMIRLPLINYIPTSGMTYSLKIIYIILDFVLAIFMAAFVAKEKKGLVATLGCYSIAVIWPVFAANSALNGGFEVRNAVILMIILLTLQFIGSKNRAGFLLYSLAVCILQILQGDGVLVKLTNCWPNLYTLISETGYVNEYGIDGKLFVLAMLLVIFYYFSKQKDMITTPKILVMTGLFFSLFISFFYPFMNYRSGFLANVFAILLFFMDRRKFYIPTALCVISYTSYAYYYNLDLWVNEPVYFYLFAHFCYAFALLILMLLSGGMLYKELQDSKKKDV